MNIFDVINELDTDNLSVEDRRRFFVILHAFSKLQERLKYYDDCIKENNSATTNGDATWRETNERMDRIEEFLNTLCKDQPDLPAARLWTARKVKELLGLSEETLKVHDMLSRIIEDQGK